MRDHYDVAVLGFWYGQNYGSLLNGYATNRILSKLGKSIYLVSKLNAAKDDYELNNTHNYRFAQKYYNPEDISPPIMYGDLDKLNDLCDTFLIGSDQVWNYGLSFSERMYLSFVSKDKRCISFASSFGHQKDFTPDDRKPFVRKHLEKFTAISVREQFSVDILRNNYGINGELVFEPVFCLDKSEFDVIANNSNINETEPFILTYILDPTPEKRAAIVWYGENANMKVINILDGIEKKYDENNALLNLPNTPRGIGAEDFLKLYKQAAFVITDSFHGTAFSIIFNKPFISIVNHRRGAERFYDLTGRLGLQERLITDPKKITLNKEFLSAIDYGETNDIIEAEKERTVLWLNNALETPVKLMSDTNNRDMDTKTDSVKLSPFYGTESYKNKINEAYSVCSKDKCTGCAACFNVCAVNAISMVEDEEGFLYPKIDNVACTNCGRCKTVCPVLNPTEKIKANKTPMAVYAAYSNNKDVRYMSTSGGITSELALRVISKKGVCYGAAYDGRFNVSHLRVDNKDDLVKLRQSKYYQSTIGSVFSQVRNDLDNGRYVLFCGTPCQCAGLSSFLGQDYKKLIIVDFICHSICSPKAFREYLKEKESEKSAKATRVWFKNKELGWHKFCMRIDFDNDDTYRERWMDDSFFLGFLKYRCFLRPSCHDCQFKEFKRASDITVADFWGLTWNNANNSDDQENGVTAMMIHTKKGGKLFSSVKNKIYSEPHSIDDVLPKNGGLMRSQRVGLYRDFFLKHLGQVPFSEIIYAMEERERKINDKKGLSNQPRADGADNITGKLTKIGNVVINMHPTAKIIINGELICNEKLPTGSQKECVLILHKNATLIVNETFKLCYDSVLQIFEGATLTLNKGFVNAGAVFGIKRNTVIGSDFLAGRNLVVYDSDHHLIVQGPEQVPINNHGRKPITVGSHVWCGINVSLLKEITVGDGSVIGAGAIVTRDIPSRCLAVGNPAKVIKTDVTWRG